MAKLELELDFSEAVKVALLKVIVKGEEKLKAPPEIKRYGEHYEFLVGVGGGHNAFITMTKEAYEELLEQEDAS